MPTFHTLEEALKEFDKEFKTPESIRAGVELYSHIRIKSFLSLVWQSAQEARNRELTEKVEEMKLDHEIFYDRLDNVNVLNRILSLINK